MKARPSAVLDRSRLKAPALVAAAVSALAIAVSGCSSDSGGGSQQTSAISTRSSGSNPAVSVQRAFADIVKTVSPAVVQIETPSGLGSGVVYDGNGNVVTNAHVVGGSHQFAVTLSGGDVHKATLVGSYPAGDLAVIHLSDSKPRPATFGDSSKIQVGDFTLAIGNPLGLRSSVTQGIVSSVGRTVSEGNGAAIPSAIQTSAPINPGNSGGALVDVNAHVIGIPTLAATDPEFGGAQAQGIGFAIPSNTVNSIAHKLISTGRIPPTQRAYLGVGVATIVGGGVVVTRVIHGGPADKAGIRPGEVIISIGGQPLATTGDLTGLLRAFRPGQRVPVEVASQNGNRRTVQVTLGAAPAR